MSEGTPKEQRSKRVESQKLLQERAVRQLPKDWDHFKIKDILILNHTDKKFAKRVGDHAAAMMAWFDKTFPYVADRAAAVRRCAEAEGVDHAAEALGHFFLRIASQVEGLEHDLRPVIPDRAREDLVAIAGKVILIAEQLRLGRQAVEYHGALNLNIDCELRGAHQAVREGGAIAMHED